MKVIVTAGHFKSIHTICLLQQLLHHNHEVLGVFVVSTFQVRRLKNYLRQYGLNTVVEKFKSHFLHKSGSTLSNETKHIKNYSLELGLKENDLISFSKSNQIPLIKVKNLNSPNSISQAQKLNPELIIYSGGGILKKGFIESSKYTVLNAHSGPLPKVRGMNCIEWSILLGYKPTTSIHLIDAGIDTGSILHQEEIAYDETDDLYDIRGKATVHNIHLLIKVLNGFKQYYSNRKLQKTSQGKQYFVMHERLKTIVKSSLLRERN